MIENGSLARRRALLLPLVLAGCGGRPEPLFEPLRYNYLPPIQLNVATITIGSSFVPSRGPSDVSPQDPVPPLVALKSMANDRLQAFGTANKAVFDIADASLTRQNDVITGTLAVSLVIQDDAGARLGFAEARVQGRHTGPADDLRSTLYDLTKSMMTDMNIEFEYQIRHNLKDWLTDTVAPDTPVEQTPLEQPSRVSPQ